MTRNENARRQPGADTLINYGAEHNALIKFRQLFRWLVTRWVCPRLCHDRFFDRDASLEIDRLILENERLRAGGTR